MSYYIPPKYTTFHLGWARDTIRTSDGKWYEGWKAIYSQVRPDLWNAYTMFGHSYEPSED